MARELTTPARLATVFSLSPSVQSPTSAISPHRAFLSPAAGNPGSPAIVGIHAETPGSAACAAFEAVANALEKDLEDEKRERREQVGFLSKSYSQEKDLLVDRTEALERQMLEARSLWHDERKLLTERLQKAEAATGGGEKALRQAEDAAAEALRSSREEAEKCAAAVEKAERSAETRIEVERSQIEARGAKLSGSYQAIVSRNACLEVELDAERRSSTAALETAERSAATRLAALEAERDRAAKEHSERLEEEAGALRRANEEAARRAKTSDEELAALRLEVQQREAAHAHLEHDAELRLQQAVAQAHAEAQEATAHVRKECEEEGKEAMMRAIWQLQQTDDCVQTMRQQQTQEAAACTSQRIRADELQRRVVEESNESHRLAASLSTCQAEQRELKQQLRSLEQELDAERAELCASREANREAVAYAARERLETAALLDQLQMRDRDAAHEAQRQLQAKEHVAQEPSYFGSLPGRLPEDAALMYSAPLGETRLPPHWSMQQLESTMQAAELERRLWDRVESPPRWRPLTTTMASTGHGSLSKAPLADANTHAARREMRPAPPPAHMLADLSAHVARRELHPAPPPAPRLPVVSSGEAWRHWHNSPAQG